MSSATMLTPWAASIVLDVGIPGGGPRPGDRCEAPGCTATFAPDDVVYHVTELDRAADGHEPYVCWRHHDPTPEVAGRDTMVGLLFATLEDDASRHEWGGHVIRADVQRMAGRLAAVLMTAGYARQEPT